MKRESSRISPSALTEAEKTINFLDSPWEPPDWAKSVRYSDYVQPRRFGRGGEKFGWDTTTGRHCCLGGFGEQCDVFGEGQISEFAIFGPGKLNLILFFVFFNAILK